MIEAKKNKAFEYLFAAYNRHILKKHFYRIHLSGEDNFRERRKNLPTIIYSNHSNWWDGLVCFYLSYDHWKEDAYMMMDINQMRKYKFFRMIGAFSVNRESAFESFETIKYSHELLKNPERVLWIFPQGEMLPQDVRPLKFQRGTAKIAQMAGGANIIPAVISYEYLKEQRAEIFIKTGRPLEAENTDNPDKLTAEMEKILEEELNIQKKNIADRNTGDYKIIFGGKESRNKIIDRLTDNG